MTYTPAQTIIDSAEYNELLSIKKAHEGITAAGDNKIEKIEVALSKFINAVPNISHSQIINAFIESFKANGLIINTTSCNSRELQLKISSNN